MAFSPKPFLIFTLFALLASLHTHARDAQLFNKVHNKNVVPDSHNEQQQQQPDFLPDNDNGYGLEGHKYDQLPPSTTAESKQSPQKYFTKNYNSVSYVTRQDDLSDNTAFRQENSFDTNPDTQQGGPSDNDQFTQENSFTTNPDNSNYYHNDAGNNYNDQQQEPEYRSYEATRTRRNDNNYYYGGGSSFNSQPQEMTTNEYRGSATPKRRGNYFDNVEDGNFQPQGMSDTRSLENGKYFYDINTQKYSSSHPYQRLRNSAARNEYTNMNYYGDSEFDRANSMGGYHNQNKFQDEDTYNMP